MSWQMCSPGEKSNISTSWAALSPWTPNQPFSQLLSGPSAGSYWDNSSWWQYPHRQQFKYLPKPACCQTPAPYPHAIQSHSKTNRITIWHKPWNQEVYKHLPHTTAEPNNVTFFNRIDTTVNNKYPTIVVPSQKKYKVHNAHKRNLSATSHDLKTIMVSLMQPTLQKSTYVLYKNYHSYFDQLLNSINHQPLPTVDNILLMIADMLSKTTAIIISAGWLIPYDTTRTWQPTQMKYYPTLR